MKMNSVVTSWNNSGSRDVRMSLEETAKQLKCTVDGLFYKAGNKFLSHIATSRRMQLIKAAIRRYYRTLTNPHGPTIPSWLKNYVLYQLRKLKDVSTILRRRRRKVRPSRASAH